MTEAGPSVPVQVLGLSDVAEAGDGFVVAPNEKIAAKVAATREHWHRLASLGRDASATSGGAKLEDVFEQIQRGETATLNLIVKADVNGSLEAVTDSLRKLERDDVKLAFVSRGVGGITENDVMLAATSNATILGFNVRPDRKAREVAEAEQVEIRSYEIIYKLLEDIENAMLGMLEPEFEEVVTGDAEVREIFRVPRIGAIAGCMVLNGTITRNSKVRFLREGTIIWKGTVQSLRRFKDDVREVQAGFECGIGLSDFQDLKPGDIIETYEEREIPRHLAVPEPAGSRLVRRANIVHVCVLTADLHLPMAQSLKAKRSVVQSIVRTLDGWSSVAAAEVDHLDTWQRTTIGLAVVANSVERVGEVSSALERYIWRQPDVVVLSIDRDWWEQP